MDGFKKISLSSSQDMVKPMPSTQTPPRTRVMGNKRMSRFSKKTLGILVGCLLIFVLGSFFVVVLPAQRTYKSAMKTQAQAKIAYDALKKTKY
jgi:hypothetical protein